MIKVVLLEVIVSWLQIIHVEIWGNVDLNNHVVIFNYADISVEIILGILLILLVLLFDFLKVIAS